MSLEIKIPSPGESITQVLLANWLVENGAIVEKDQEIAEIDSDKATLAISSPERGKITILIEAGTNVAVGAIAATLEVVEGEVGNTTVKVDVAAVKEVKSSGQDALEEKPVTAEPEKVVGKSDITGDKSKGLKDKEVSLATPLARQLMAEHGITDDKLKEFFARYHFTREDVKFYLENKDRLPDNKKEAKQREDDRQVMTPLRKKLAERLVSVKNQTAMLTTFNEVNMTPIFELRNKYKDKFKEKHGVSLGFMSFFTRACSLALMDFPMVNAMIDGDEIVTHNYTDIGIAVSTPKGLMVPVLRNAEEMTLADIEAKIKELATKARDKKITLEELSGGTFTITNGGVFGSLLSTPIINPPQSAILGMHNIVERPIAVKGKVEIHPMMYVALSYDHRIIDGKDSVSFLVRVKELLENPVRLAFDDGKAEERLFGL